MDGNDPPDARNTPHDAFPGAEALRGRSPREVLHRLLEHDPFELEARTRERVEERAYLVSPDRVWLRALARVAHGAMRYRGHPTLDAWLRDRIDQSLEEILGEDVQAEIDQDPLPAPLPAHLVFVAESFGLPIQLTRHACIRFNALDPMIRRTFFALTFHRKSVHRWAAEGHGPPHSIREQLEQAARALAQYPDPDDLDLQDVSW